MVLNAPPEWIEEIDQACLAADSQKVFSEDPVLLAASRRVTRLNLIHWAAANVENPGAHVSSYLTTDLLSNARELVRRGSIDVMFKASRAAESAAWQRWMCIAFELTSDPAELRELLDVSARSIAAFANANMDQIASEVALVCRSS